MIIAWPRSSKVQDAAEPAVAVHLRDAFHDRVEHLDQVLRRNAERVAACQVDAPCHERRLARNLVDVADYPVHRVQLERVLAVDAAEPAPVVRAPLGYLQHRACHAAANSANFKRPQAEWPPCSVPRKHLQTRGRTERGEGFRREIASSKQARQRPRNNHLGTAPFWF